MDLTWERFFIIMVEDIEIWKDVIDYEGHYLVSSKGRVKSLKRWIADENIILKQSGDGRGYLQVALTKNGKCKTWKIHKLVAIAFLDHKQRGMDEVINHIDGNKMNNNIDNIEITSQRKNMNQYFKLNNDKFSSQYIGAHWDKNIKKWTSSVKVHKTNKRYRLGYFNTEREASEAYLNKLKELNLT